MTEDTNEKKIKIGNTNSIIESKSVGFKSIITPSENPKINIGGISTDIPMPLPTANISDRKIDSTISQSKPNIKEDYNTQNYNNQNLVQQKILSELFPDDDPIPSDWKDILIKTLTDIPHRIHNDLGQRGDPDCHPESSITGLSTDMTTINARITSIFTSLDKSSRILGNITKTTIDVIGATYPMYFLIGSATFIVNTNQTITIATALDVGIIQAGKDYYIYACNNSGTLTFVVSLASSFPAGYSTITSIKIGGFHTLCVSVLDIAGSYTARANTTVYALDVIRRPVVANSRYYRCVTAGTSAGAEPAAFTSDTTTVGTKIIDGTVAWKCEGHDLNNYVANDILSQSVWDLRFRSRNGMQAGMVYDPFTMKWVDIYLSSDDGMGGSQSVYNATILDTMDWLTFVDRGAKVGMRLLDDDEFQSIATGSNEETNIVGSVDPVTTGGHSDTAGRRMISNIGCEDCVGAMWQWLITQSYRADDLFTTFSYYNLPGAKGSLYRQGTYGDVKLRAGGHWDDGTACGSRSRYGSYYRWDAASTLGGRFCAEPL